MEIYFSVNKNTYSDCQGSTGNEEITFYFGITRRNLTTGYQGCFELWKTGCIPVGVSHNLLNKVWEKLVQGA